jgi:hypothetical protein
MAGAGNIPNDAYAEWLKEFDLMDLDFPRSLVPFTSIGKLPQELLLHVAGCLDPHDLASLARVSQEFCIVSVDRLYATITLSSHNKCDYPTFALHRTFCKRPELSALVKSFRYHTQESREIKVPAGDLSPYMPATAPSVGITIDTDRLAGAIISGACTNLEVLHITTDRKYTQTLTDLFGNDGPDVSFDHMNGLRELKYLKFDGTYLDWNWIRLPSLQTLAVNHCTGNGIGMSSRSSASSIPTDLDTSKFLKTFSLEVAQSGLIPGHMDEYYIYLREFMEAVSPSLRELAIKLYDFEGDWGWASQTQPGDFERLIYQLRPSEPTLETLDLSHSYSLHDDDGGYQFSDDPGTWGFLEWVSPCRGFASFSTLKHLKVQYKCLIGSTNITMCELPETRLQKLKTMLPPSLEALVIDPPKLKFTGCSGQFWGMMENSGSTSRT